MTFSATGPVTNLAARIAGAATSGDILVGPETAKRIKDEIKVYGERMTKFKNVANRVRISSLVETSDLGGGEDA
jgi:class 3 adenylate cyclase